MTANPLFLAGQRLSAGDLALLSPDRNDYTPVWANVTLGTVGLVNEGIWWQIGREINWAVTLTLGTGGSVTSTIELDYPDPPGPSDGFLGITATAWATPTGSTNRHAGSATGDADGITRIVSAATNTGWNATVPFTWAAGSTLRMQGAYLLA